MGKNSIVPRYLESNISVRKSEVPVNHVVSGTVIFFNVTPRDRYTRELKDRAEFCGALEKDLEEIRSVYRLPDLHQMRIMYGQYGCRLAKDLALMTAGVYDWQCDEAHVDMRHPEHAVRIILHALKEASLVGVVLSSRYLKKYKEEIITQSQGTGRVYSRALVANQKFFKELLGDYDIRIVKLTD